MHYHLEPVGGIAGDMFAAALLDYCTEWQDALSEAIRVSGLVDDLTVRARPHKDAILAGHRFEVIEPADQEALRHHRWLDIRERLRGSQLDANVKGRAIAIFELLANAEAEVHGSPLDQVTFHEVGGWDSIADIVTAAWLIEHSDATRWSCAPVPLGRGRVAGAHGQLPVPAPATGLLLRGFPVFDDGLEGERVTPTGAAILKHLAPQFGASTEPSTLVGQGYGFGTKTFPGISNILRVSVFDPVRSRPSEEHLVVCQFEVDDQTPEDLAVGLERLRDAPGVLDVIQAPVFGKKGRLATHVRVLGEVSRLDTIVDRCLTETTTLGVRWHTVNRKVLPRDQRRHTLGGEEVRVKRASRPGGIVTRKVEMADLVGTGGGHAGREQRRREVYARDLENDRDTPSPSGAHE